MSYVFRIDPAAMTLGDNEDFEDYTGKSLDEALKLYPEFDDEGNRVIDEETGRPKMKLRLTSKAITALVWIVNRKTIDGFTIADARNVEVGELEVPDSAVPEEVAKNE